MDGDKFGVNIYIFVMIFQYASVAQTSKKCAETKFYVFSLIYLLWQSHKTLLHKIAIQF